MQIRLKSREEKQNINFSCTPFCIEIDNDTLNDVRHAHDYHQLTFVMKGSAKLHVNGFEQRIREGNVYVIGAYSRHVLTNQKNLQIANICFYINDLIKDVKSLANSAGFRSLFFLQPTFADTGKLSSLLHLDYSGVCYVNDLIGHMLDEVSSKKPGNDISVQSYFLLLVTYLSRSYDNISSLNEYSESLYRAVSYINKNLTKDIRISKLTEISCLCERQLRRLFREEYGCTPNSYIFNARLRRACYFLEFSNMSITEVAWNSGFSDSNYFSRRFREAFNLTPKMYRKQRK